MFSSKINAAASSRRHWRLKTNYSEQDYSIHLFDLQNYFVFLQVMDIKRLNNMMSDHGIHSRERLLIPISDPVLLHDSTCFIEMDAYAKREVAVLHPHGRPDGKSTHASDRRITERGKRRILESVKRSMQVDDGTAEYYLSIANGDPRAAILEFSEDLRWEHHRGH